MKPKNAYILVCLLYFFALSCDKHFTRPHENELRMESSSRNTGIGVNKSLLTYGINGDNGSVVSTTIINFKGGADSGLIINGTCSFGAGPGNFVKFNGIEVRATHGRPEYFTEVGPFTLRLDGFYSIDAGHVGEARGSGVAIKFPFEAGYKYAITYSGTLNDKKLQFRLTNNPIYTTNPCTITNPAVDLTTLGPSEVFASLTNADLINNSAQFDLNPASSFDYLWLSGHPNSPSSAQTFQVWSVKIEKIIPYAISGPSALCSTTNYTISNLPASATVNWTVSNPSIVALSAGVGSASLSRIGNGPVTLSAEVNVDGVSYNLWKSIYSGTVDIGGSYTSGSYFNNLNPLHNCLKLISGSSTTWRGDISLSGVPPDAIVEWSLVSKDADAVTYLDGGGANPSVYVGPSGRYATYKVKITTPCGTTEALFPFIANGTCIRGGR